MITSQSRFQPFLRQLTECLCWGHLGFWSKRKSLRKSTPLLFVHAVVVQLMGQPCFSCTVMVMALKPWKPHAEVGVQNSRCLLFLFFNTSFFFFFFSYSSGMGPWKWDIFKSGDWPQHPAAVFNPGSKVKVKGCSVFGVISHHWTQGTWLFCHD